jgi:hypothetical protein
LLWLSVAVAVATTLEQQAQAVDRVAAVDRALAQMLAGQAPQGKGTTVALETAKQQSPTEQAVVAAVLALSGAMVLPVLRALAVLVVTV